MPAVLLNSRNDIELIINNTNLSREFSGVSASYSSLSLPNGLCLMTGSLQLTQTNNTLLDFDNRFTSFWKRGTEITLKQNNKFLPICGKSYIISADYDMKSSLNINFGCALALNNVKSATDIGVCLEFGAEFNLAAAIYQMLQATGISNISPQLLRGKLSEFKISEPLLIGKDQSVLQAAGTLAGQHGFLLIQRNDGVILAQSILSDEDYLHVSRPNEIQSYTRSNQPETVTSRYVFDYNIVTPISPLNTEATSIQSDDIIVDSETIRDDNIRTLKTSIKEYRGLNILVSESTISSSFESESQQAQALDRQGQIISIEECFPDSQARIIKRITENKSDNTEVLKAWLATQAVAVVPSSFTLSGVITSEKTEELWEYTPTKITKTTNIYQAYGKAIPLVGDLKLGRTTLSAPINDIDPKSLIIGDKIIEQWVKSLDIGQAWTYTKIVYRNRYLVKPEDFTQQVLVSSIQLQTISDQAVELIPIDKTVEYNQSEPTFEYYQNNSEVIKTAKTLEIGASVLSEFEAEKNLSFGDYLVFDEEYFTKYAQKIMDFENGRIFGMQIALNLFDLQDYWSNIKPLQKTKIMEPSHLRTNVASVFLIDSPSIVISKEEAILAYTGSFIGFSENPENRYYFTDIINKPASLPLSEKIATLTFDEMKASNEHLFTFIYIP